MDRDPRTWPRPIAADRALQWLAAPAPLPESDILGRRGRSRAGRGGGCGWPRGRTGHFGLATRNDEPPMRFGRGGLPQRWATDVAAAATVGHCCGLPAWPGSIGGPSLRVGGLEAGGDGGGGPVPWGVTVRSASLARGCAGRTGRVVVARAAGPAATSVRGRGASGKPFRGPRKARHGIPDGRFALDE